MKRLQDVMLYSILIGVFLMAIVFLSFTGDAKSQTSFDYTRLVRDVITEKGVQCVIYRDTNGSPGGISCNWSLWKFKRRN